MCACQKSYTSIIMTSITWAGPRCVQELATFLEPQNRTQGRCEVFCVELSPRLKYFHLYSIYITLTDLLPRFRHHNLHSQNTIPYSLHFPQNESFHWSMRCYVRYYTSCQRMICTTVLACIIKLLVSRGTGGGASFRLRIAAEWLETGVRVSLWDNQRPRTNCL